MKAAPMLCYSGYEDVSVYLKITEDDAYIYDEDNGALATVIDLMYNDYTEKFGYRDFMTIETNLGFRDEGYVLTVEGICPYDEYCWLREQIMYRLRDFDCVVYDNTGIFVEPF